MATTRRRQKTKGRNAGSRNKGYWYYTDRGWYTTEIDRPRLALRDEAGNHIKDARASREVLERAYALRLVARKEEAAKQAQAVTPTAIGRDSITVGQVCSDYLKFCQANQADATFQARAALLFDFVTGFPARFRDKGDGKRRPKPTEADRIHKGYGKLTIAELLPYHAQAWIDAHPQWGADGGNRVALQALKRALNWAANDMKLISRNPIYGFKVPRGRSRVVYFTPEQETAMLDRKHCKPDFALALKVCIRTGARYGIEFAALQQRHVKETEQGMIWHFPKAETKTRRKDRIIYVAPEIAEIVRQQMKGRSGYVFRNSQGKPWTANALTTRFTALKRRLAKRGIKLDADAVMYATRHTYAKRMLSGYWGHRVTLLDLAELMGDTRETIIKHYTIWDDTHNERLWHGINGGSLKTIG